MIMSARSTDNQSGMCFTKRDAKASNISLFYSFTADLVTDLMSTLFFNTIAIGNILISILVMIFPLQILWKLKIGRLRKYSIMALFAVGTLCIITSILRIVKIHAKSGWNQATPSWLMLWAMIEAAIGMFRSVPRSPSLL